MNARTRMLVYDKYGGRCAYCGRELRLDEMQVDHIVPVWRGHGKGSHPYGRDKGSDTPDNYNPACRACNFRKGTLSVEEFRKALREQCAGAVKRSFQVRQSIAYGLLSWHDKEIVFYFETCGSGEGKDGGLWL